MNVNVVESSPAKKPVPDDQNARIFVWGLWLLMVLIALGCLIKYAHNIPLAEDWQLVAPLTGHEPNILGWLWSQNNEHRVPLPRFLLLILLKLTHDFRIGMLCNILILAGLAGLYIQGARALRGGYTDWADAFFPALFLHLGHWENLFWGWQLSFVVPASLICGLLFVIIRWPTLAAPVPVIFAGLSLVLLPLCGAIGLVFVPFFSLWLAYWGWRSTLSTKQPSWIGWFLMGSAILALMLMVAYFIGYQRPDWNPPSPGIGATLATTAKFLALGLGPASGSYWPLFVLIAFAILVPSLGILAQGWLKTQGFEKQRALGLLLFCGSFALFALAMGWGRSGLVPTVGMPIRYVLLAVPGFCAAFFGWNCGSPWSRLRVQRVLAGILCLLIPLNTMAVLYWRDWYHQGMMAVERDIQAGLPVAVLAQRHRDFLLHWDEAMLAKGMQMLRDAKIGPFAQLPQFPSRPE
jgi:hypothetical protein